MKDNMRLFTAQTPNLADIVTLARPRTQHGRHSATGPPQGACPPLLLPH